MAPDAGPTARLTSAMLVGALRRRVAAAGGFATVIVKGDEISGVILIQTLEKGELSGLFERVSNFAGGHALLRCGPDVGEGVQAIDAYLARRRRSDPDLWVVELDIPQAERFAVETLC
ncbi:DUF1491 family protein [Sphingobium sp.]|uniref:DUF1491 family protein n=1 Tax=Sphingobium sp. TaxID=1912891 RepID=UPI003B3BE219